MGARRLMLLGGFALVWAGEEIAVSRNGERLLAFLAVSGRPQRRDHVAWTLWENHTEAHAMACLRTAVWRLPRPDGGSLLSGTHDRLALVDHLEVDWCIRSRQAQDVIAGYQDGDDDLIGSLASDLLPDWYEVWLVSQRERFRQLRLNALEVISQRRLAAGRWYEALNSALFAVACEPFRESAHRCVIAAHLAVGNRYEAMSQYRRYMGLLKRAGLRPEASQALIAMLPDGATTR